MSTVTAESVREHRVTLPGLRSRKRKGEKITMLTAYDFTFAQIFDSAGIDILLVGDSLGNVVQGEATTLPVTLEESLYHTRLVARGTRRALVVRRHALRQLPDLAGRRGAQRHPLREGERGACREARGRHGHARDHRAHRHLRDSGDGSRRPHAPGDPPHGGAPGAGPQRGEPRQGAGGRPGRRGGRCVRRRARGGTGRARPGGDRKRSRSPPSASEPACTATVRCW